MPIYEYKCVNCRRTRTEIRSIKDRRREAPTCVCKAFMILTVSPVAGGVKNPAVPRRRK